MDRLVKVEAAEVELQFRPSERCAVKFKVTSLIHTMPVAVMLTTSRPSAYSFSPDAVALLPPLASAVFTLILLPAETPPVASTPDRLLIGTALSPALHRASSAALRRFLSRPALHTFRDASIPIHLLGPHALRSLLVPSAAAELQRAILLSRIIPSCSVAEISAALPLAAAAYGGASAVSALLLAGADPDSCGIGGKSAISLAVSAGSAEAVEALIEAGATDRPLHDAAAVNRTDLILLLATRLGSKQAPANWADAADAEGRTPVHAAAAAGALDALRLCFSSGGGDPDRADIRGWTPLHCAASGGHLGAAELLISSSPFDPRRTLTREGKGRMRRTPLDLAVEKGHAHMYALLRQEGGVIRAARSGAACELAAAGGARERDQNGWTALHVAAFKGRVEAVWELVGDGAELEAVDDVGYTPLHCAVEAGHSEVALWLIGCGARAGLKGLFKSKAAAAALEAWPVKRQQWEACEPPPGQLLL